MPTLEDIIRTYGKIPSLAAFRRPMFIGPHPDDIEFGCGALISKLKDTGADVTFVIVTDGAAGTVDPSITPEIMAETRKKESLTSAAFLGVKSVEFLNLPDGGDYEVIDIIKALAPVILKYQPDIIFAPDPKLKTECHPDHLKTGEAVRRLPQLISYPESLRRLSVNIDGVEVFPANVTLAFYFSDDCNVIEEVSENNLNEKFQSLMLHSSQMQDASTGLLLNYFKLKAMKLGEDTVTGFGENYQVLLPLVQHCFSEGIHYNTL